MQYAIATTVGRTIVKTIIRSICEKVELPLAARKYIVCLMKPYAIRRLEIDF